MEEQKFHFEPATKPIGGVSSSVWPWRTLFIRIRAPHSFSKKGIQERQENKMLKRGEGSSVKDAAREVAGKNGKRT